MESRNLKKLGNIIPNKKLLVFKVKLVGNKKLEISLASNNGFLIFRLKI